MNVVIPSGSISHNGVMLVGLIHMDSPQDDMQNKNREILASPTIRSREKKPPLFSLHWKKRFLIMP
jgi:hypothetical protein